MANWTNITDNPLEPGRPIRSVDGLALRDNPIAMAQGAPGAPRIQNPAYEIDSIDASKLQIGAATRFGTVPFNLTFGDSSGTSYAEVVLDAPLGHIGVVMAQWDVSALIPGRWARIYAGSTLLIEGDQNEDSQLWSLFVADVRPISVRIEFQRPAGGVATATGKFIVFSPVR